MLGKYTCDYTARFQSMCVFESFDGFLFWMNQPWTQARMKRIVSTSSYACPVWSASLHAAGKILVFYQAWASQLSAQDKNLQFWQLSDIISEKFPQNERQDIKKKMSPKPPNVFRKGQNFHWKYQLYIQRVRSFEKSYYEMLENGVLRVSHTM